MVNKAIIISYIYLSLADILYQKSHRIPIQQMASYFKFLYPDGWYLTLDTELLFCTL
jgi:hypothetical protein